MASGGIVLIVEPDGSRATQYASNITSSGAGYLIARSATEALDMLATHRGISDVSINGVLHLKPDGRDRLTELVRKEKGAD